MSTAVSVAVSHPEIQIDLLGIIRIIDRSIEKRLRQAVKEGQLPPEFNTSARADIAQGILHSLSLRARAGDSKSALNSLLNSGVEVIVS